MNKLVEQFITPAGLLVIFGIIIWGVQLNWGLISVIKKNKEQDVIQQEILAKQVEVTANVQKSALLLSILLDDMREVRANVNEHHKEAEMWKEKIRQNSNSHRD